MRSSAGKQEEAWGPWRKEQNVSLEVLVRFGCALSPKGSRAGSLVPGVAMLRSGGVCKRWGLVGDRSLGPCLQK